jgi:hypothetical protein
VGAQRWEWRVSWPPVPSASPALTLPGLRKRPKAFWSARCQKGTTGPLGPGVSFSILSFSYYQPNSLYTGSRILKDYSSYTRLIRLSVCVSVCLSSLFVPFILIPLLECLVNKKNNIHSKKNKAKISAVIVTKLLS